MFSCRPGSLRPDSAWFMRSRARLKWATRQNMPSVTVKYLIQCCESTTCMQNVHTHTGKQLVSLPSVRYSGWYVHISPKSILTYSRMHVKPFDSNYNKAVPRLYSNATTYTRFRMSAYEVVQGSIIKIRHL